MMTATHYLPAQRKPEYVAAREKPRLTTMGRLLVGAGVLLVVVGLLVMGLQRIGVPWGRLPGEFSYRGKNFEVFAPLGTSLFLSALISLVLYLLTRFRR